MGHYDWYYEKYTCGICGRDNLNWEQTSYFNKYDAERNEIYKPFVDKRVCKWCLEGVEKPYREALTESRTIRLYYKLLESDGNITYGSHSVEKDHNFDYYDVEIEKLVVKQTLVRNQGYKDSDITFITKQEYENRGSVEGIEQVKHQSPKPIIYTTSEGEIRAHELKTCKTLYNSIIEEDKLKRKNFDVRKFDRDFQVGDVLVLKEYDSENKRYTGRAIWRLVTFILAGEPYLPKETCVMGLEEVWKVIEISGIKQDV